MNHQVFRLGNYFKVNPILTSEGTHRSLNLVWTKSVDSFQCRVETITFILAEDQRFDEKFMMNYSVI